MEVENLIIIGSGPAGYTAAIYAARAELSPLIIEGAQPGGQLMLTTEVENFPGFPEGIQGPELMNNFKKQAERFGTRFQVSNVVSVDLESRPFKLRTEDKEYQTRSIIIATGAEARWLGVPGEEKLKGKGVSVCATCDGFFFKDKRVVVVGGGDSAMEEASFLTKFASKVTVMVRKDTLKASDIMRERAEADPKIEFMFNTEVKEILGEDKVTGLKIVNNKSGEESEFACDGVFLAIGRVPSTAIFEGKIDLTKGYIVTKEDSTETSVPGVFASGDVVDWKYRQAITSAADGCRAAIDAERFIEGE